MLDRFKSRWVFVVLVLLVLGTGSVACIQLAPRVLPTLNAIVSPQDAAILPDAPVPVTAAQPTPGPGQAVVKRGSIADVLTLNGRVAGQDETVVLFHGSGQVRAIDVKLGSTVEQGDPLVETNSQDIRNQIAQAQGELETAQIRLEQARAQTDADAAAQQRDATQQASNAASQRQAQLTDAQAALHVAQANLDKVRAGPSDADVRAAQAAVANAQSDAQRAEADLARVQQGPDPAQVSAAQAQLDSAQMDYDKAQGALDNLTRGPDAAAVRSAQRDVDRAMAALKAAQATPIDPKDPHVDKARADKDAAVAFAQSDVQAAQDRLVSLQQPPGAADLSVARGAVQIAATKLAAAKQALADLKAGPNQKAVDQAQSVVDNAHLAQQNAEDRLAELMSHPTPQESRAAQDQLKAAQSAVDRANAIGTLPATSSSSQAGAAYNLVLLEKDVARNQALVDSLQQDLAASMVTAPFNGLVTGIQVHVDDKLTKDAPVIRLARVGAPVVVVDMTTAEAASVSVGAAATVTLDTLGGPPLEAKVSSVQDAATGRSGRVMQLNVDWRADTPPYGSLGQVQLDVNHKDGVLLVPKKAVHSAGSRRFVQVQSGSTRKVVNVEVGIVSSDSAEITSGLSEGQIVFVSP